ncbi:hypothetical protein [Microbulbifer sp. 2201CG32-9]|uniref:hypothetical protein n=1 Tax=unclassified Microbulbifer TaxID=2619833 RepID=UPI00345BF206
MAGIGDSILYRGGNGSPPRAQGFVFVAGKQGSSSREKKVPPGPPELLNGLLGFRCIRRPWIIPEEAHR